MKVYTSYYKKLADNPRGLLLVRISTSVPSWFPWDTIELSELYPGWDLVNDIKNGYIDEEHYTEQYNIKLSRLSKADIQAKLQKLSDNNNGRDIVLLCYEGPGKFCHRYRAGEWLDMGITEFVLRGIS